MSKDVVESKGITPFAKPTNKKQSQTVMDETKNAILIQSITQGIKDYINENQISKKFCKTVTRATIKSLSESTGMREMIWGYEFERKTFDKQPLEYILQFKNFATGLDGQLNVEGKRQALVKACHSRINSHHNAQKTKLSASQVSIRDLACIMPIMVDEMGVMRDDSLANFSTSSVEKTYDKWVDYTKRNTDEN